MLIMSFACNLIIEFLSLSPWRFLPEKCRNCASEEKVRGGGISVEACKFRLPTRSERNPVGGLSARASVEAK